MEVRFSILSHQALLNSSFQSVRALVQRIDDYIAAYNRAAHPFSWKASEVHPSAPKSTIGELLK